MRVTIESIRDGDEPRRIELGRQAFSGTATYDPEAPTLPAERIVAAYAGDRLLGTVATHEFDMYWGSQPVPCGGVSGVLVVPEARGRDLARRMLLETFDRMHDRGEVLGGLYPTTATLYRSVGFEVSGWWRTTSVALSELPTRAADELEWRRTELDDDALIAVARAMAPAHDGWLRHQDLWWRWRAHRARSTPEVNRYAYVGSSRDGADVAALIFSYTDSSDALYDLQTELVAGIGGDGLGAALGFLGRHGTTAGRVATTLPPHLLERFVPHPQRMRTERQWAWMLRLADVAGCIERRGWPTGVTARVAFDVVDDLLRRNAGPATLEVAEGKAAWVPGGPGTIRVRVQDLAALYAGADSRVLALTGRLSGASEHDLGMLRAAFASTPSAVDFY